MCSVQFSNSYGLSSEDAAEQWFNCAQEVTAKMSRLLVFKLLNVDPECASEANFARFEEEFPGFRVYINNINNNDTLAMHTCDADLVIGAMDGSGDLRQVVEFWRRMAMTEFHVKYCQKCQSFFTPSKSKTCGKSNGPHEATQDQFSNICVFIRQFMPWADEEEE